MNRLPSFPALLGAALLALLAWWLTFESGVRLLSTVGWLIGLLLGGGAIGMLLRTGESDASSRSLDIPREHRAAAEHLIEMICRARDLDPDEAAGLVLAAWRGETGALAARRIILAPGISGARALTVLERRFAREARFAASEPWEPGERETPPLTRPIPDGGPAVPRGLDALFADARRDQAAADSVAADRVDAPLFDPLFDPLDGDPPPDGVVAAEAPGSLGDFADESEEAAPPSVSTRTDTTLPTRPIADLDPYAEEEWNEPWGTRIPPSRWEPVAAEDDPFRELFPDGDELEEQGPGRAPSDGEIDRWLEEPAEESRRAQRPNPFAPDTPIEPPRPRRGAFRARLDDEERR